MAAALTTAVRVLTAGLIGTALATGVHFISLTSGVARGLASNPQALSQVPGLPATWGALATDCLIAALPVLPVVALTAFAGRFLMGLGFLAAWAWGADRLGLAFAAVRGGTFGWGDGLTLFYTVWPLTWIAVLAAIFALTILAPRSD